MVLFTGIKAFSKLKDDALSTVHHEFFVEIVSQEVSLFSTVSSSVTLVANALTSLAEPIRIASVHCGTHFLSSFTIGAID